MSVAPTQLWWLLPGFVVLPFKAAVMYSFVCSDASFDV